MCGIAGLITFGRRNVDRGALDRMVAAIEHRGPDGQGTAWVDGSEHSVGLGHVRLSILDLSAAGRQPMSASTGDIVSFNGEIYNFKDLRAALDDDQRPWTSQSDTEVLLRGYEVWGRACLDRLRGMFAFALWDARRQTLLLARDRLGIKPLYYFVGDGYLVFGSEVRALLASSLVPRKLDATALWEYLGYQSVPTPRTMIDGVRMLEPGMWLEVATDGTLTHGQYWDAVAQREPSAQEATVADARKRVGQLLTDSAHLHLVSDVPVAAFLSGGIDSSAVVALMHLAGVTPRTFSVVFEEQEFDETQYSRLVASRFGADHSEIILSENDLLDQLPEALQAMDQPTGDGINTYVVSRAVRSAGIKVALSGLGGDEFFGGYPSFRRLEQADGYLRYWRKTPASVRALTGQIARTVAGDSIRTAKIADLLSTDGSFPEAYALTRQVLSTDRRRALVADAVLDRIGGEADPYVARLHGAMAQLGGLGVMTRTSYAEARTYMHDVLLRDTDQMSMAHALEVRVPLLDHRVVEYVMGLPDDVKQSRVYPKQFLVESLEGALPRKVYERPKQGFVLPFDRWMRSALTSYCDERLSTARLEERGILRPGAVRDYWERFLRRDPAASWSRLWVLVALETWLTRHDVAL